MLPATVTVVVVAKLCVLKPELYTVLVISLVWMELKKKVAGVTVAVMVEVGAV
jgi:hypothetical protein